MAKRYTFNPSHTTLTVHPQALSAYNTWLKFRQKAPSIHLKNIDVDHKPLIRIIPYQQNHYQYFDSFWRVSDVFQYEYKTRQPFVIIKGDDRQISRMSWVEVLKLCSSQNINHSLLWQNLKKECAPSILRELMACDYLRVEDYCFFANISVEHYQYQQRGMTDNKRELGLSQNMDWLND